MQRLLLITAGLAALCAAPVVAAGPSGAAPPRDLVAYTPATPPLETIPSAVSTFATPAEATRGVSRDVVPVDVSGTVLRRTGAPVSMQSGDPPGKKRKYLPVFLSALVPGAGELYMGYIKRGIALMAVEAGAWTGYIYKHQQGLDTRTEYEAFADEHWDMRRFIDHHYLIYPTEGATLEELEDLGRAGSGSGVWPGYSPWVSKEEDKQHYYENIGKYDWYVSGWEDYVPGTTPDDLAPGEVLSRVREEYRDMRHDSNNQLDTANRFIYLSIAARVVSLVQTTILVQRAQDDDMARTDNHWMFRARSRGRDAGEVTLEYWFK